MNVKVSAVNFCYDIRKMIECNKVLRELTRKRGVYKLYMKKYMKEHKLTKEQVTQNPDLVPAPTIKTGVCKKEKMNLRMIEILMNRAQQDMVEFENSMSTEA